MIIKKIDEKLSLRDRFARMNETADEEVAAVEAGADTEPTEEAEAPEEESEEESEDKDDITITLTPDEVATLQKIISMIDKDVAAEAPADDACPGCDDPDCPDCSGADEDALISADDTFEIPDLSGLAPDVDDDSAYFN